MHLFKKQIKKKHFRSSYEIRGNKTIKGRLEVKNLFTFSFNDINPRNAVTTNTTDIIGCLFDNKKFVS